MKKGLIIVLVGFISFFCYGQESTGVKKWGLSECIDYALENNLIVKRSLYSVESSAINVKQAKWSMAPNLNTGGSYNNNWGRTIDPTTNLFTTSRVQTIGFSASTSLLLFQTSRLRNTYKQAEVDLQASKYDLEANKNIVVLNVITFFTNVVFNKEQYNNAVSQLNSTGQLLERTRKHVEAGAAPQTQLFDLLAQKANNEVNVVNWENNYNMSLLQLMQVLQIPSSEPFDVDIPQVEISEFPLSGLNGEEIFDIAHGTMPEIKSADLGIKSADLGIKISRAQLYPSLRLNGNVSTNYSSARDQERMVATGDTQTRPPTQVGTVNLDPTQIVYTFPIPDVPVFQTFEDYPIGDQFGDNIGRSLSFVLSVPIFNGFSASSNLQRAIITQHQAQITLEDRSNTLRQNIERAYLDAYAAQKSYDASQKQVEATEESFRVTQRSFELGAMNFIDFQVSQENLFQAKTNLLISKYDYIFKQEILKFYQGELNY